MANSGGESTEEAPKKPEPKATPAQAEQEVPNPIKTSLEKFEQPEIDPFIEALHREVDPEYNNQVKAKIQEGYDKMHQINKVKQQNVPPVQAGGSKEEEKPIKTLEYERDI